MSLPTDGSTALNPLQVELYKSLRAEVATCVEKIASFRVQKLTLIGGTLASLVAHYFWIPPGKSSALVGNDAIVAATVFCAVPVLAVLLDVQIGEYSIQACAVSRFIAGEFVGPNIPRVVRDWEKLLWGHGRAARYTGEANDFFLINFRSRLTVFGTALPTACLFVLTSIVVATLLNQSRKEAVALSILPCLIYAGFAGVVWSRIWPAEKNRGVKPHL